MYLDVETRFDKEIKRIFSEKEEVRNFFLKHERKKVCVERLCEQIRMYEIGKINPRIDQYETMINSLARLFCNAAMKSKEQELMTEAQRFHLIHEHDRIKELENEIQVIDG